VYECVSLIHLLYILLQILRDQYHRKNETRVVCDYMVYIMIRVRDLLCFTNYVTSSMRMGGCITKCVYFLFLTEERFYYINQVSILVECRSLASEMSLSCTRLGGGLVYRVLEATVAYATLICTFYYYYYYLV